MKISHKLLFQKKKIFISFICVLIFSIIVMVGAIGLLKPYKNDTYSDSFLTQNPKFIKVDEIYNSGSDKFDKTNLRTLLNYISGEEDSNYETVEKMIQTDDDSTCLISSDQFRNVTVGDKQEGQDILVDFGGLEWTVCALSDSDEGPILTLLLSSNMQEKYRGKDNSENGFATGFEYEFIDGYSQGLSQIYMGANDFSAYNTKGIPGLYSVYASSDTYDGSENMQSYDDYYRQNEYLGGPENMPTIYGSSYVRAVTLNNGGEYMHYDFQSPEYQNDPIYDNFTMKEYTPSETSVFADFTIGNISQYIVTPSSVRWQQYCDEGFQNYNKNGESVILQNESLYDFYYEDQQQFKYNAAKYYEINYRYGNLRNYLNEIYGGPIIDEYPFDEEIYQIIEEEVFADISGSEAIINSLSYYNFDMSDNKIALTRPTYSAWGEDKLWLPSYSEISGYSEGMWKLSTDQLGSPGNLLGVIYGPNQPLAYNLSNNSTAALFPAMMLRSVDSSNLNLIQLYRLIYSITSTNYSIVTGTISPFILQAVRPALHLNLKKATDSAGLGVIPPWQNFAADKFENEITHNPQSTSIGSENNPFEIATAEQLALIAKDVSEGVTYKDKYFKQTASIDLQTYQWKPIGIFYNNETQHSDTFPFEGNYNGQFYSINNLNILYGFYDCMGLFGYTTGSTIKNIVLNGNIEIDNGDYVNAVGGIVGLASGLTIHNCISNVDINASGCQIGEIIGSIEPFSSITKTQISNCYSLGNLNGESVGGIVGQALEETNIEKCIAKSSITCTSYGGGLIGLSTGYDLLSISNCIAYCNMTSESGSALAGFVNFYETSSDRHFLDLLNCCFYGSINVSNANPFYSSSVKLNENNVTVKGCYASYGETKVYSDETGFDNNCGWGIVDGLNIDLPLQTELFWVAGVAPIPDGYSSVLDYLKKKGFTLYSFG